MNGFGDWKDHDGGPRPHPPLTAVDVGLRCGLVQRGVSAFTAWVWCSPISDRDIVTYREIPLEYANSVQQNLDYIEQHARTFTLIFNPQERCHASLAHYLMSESLRDNWLTPQDRTQALVGDDCYEAELLLWGPLISDAQPDPITLLAATRDALIAECARQCRLQIEAQS